MIRKFLNDFINKRKETAEDKIKKAAIIRQKIMADGEMAKNLLANPDFIRFCACLIEDRDALNANLLQEDPKAIRDEKEYVRLVARINQIEKILGKPKSMIWQMENLTEVRAAVKEKQTRVRQAHGNKTGGEDNGNT